MSVFFFSSRRRHTRLQGDWSSDVCSSDLVPWPFTCPVMKKHREGARKPASCANRAPPRVTRLLSRRQPAPRSSSGKSPTRLANRSEEHTSELQSPCNLVCRLLLEKKKTSSTHT